MITLAEATLQFPVTIPEPQDYPSATIEEIVRYARCCVEHGNSVRPEILVGNYTGHLALHHELVQPTLARVIKPTDSVLDFGCGVGRVTGLLTDLARTVVGVDVSQVALSRAARIVPAAVFLQVYGEGSLPFAPESFDAVVSLICLQHIQFFPVRHRYFQSFHRVLRPGGRLLIQLNASIGGPDAHRWFCRGVPDTYLAHDVVCDESEILAYLTANNFRTLQTWRTNADSQDVSWDVVPRRTSSTWLWVLAERVTPDLPVCPLRGADDD